MWVFNLLIVQINITASTRQFNSRNAIPNLTCRVISYKLESENMQDNELNNFERLEKEVEHLIDAYATLNNEVNTIKQTTRDRSHELIELQRRVSKLEQDRQLALGKIDQLLEQLNQIDLE